VSPAVAQVAVKAQLADDVVIKKLEPRVWRHVSSKNLPNLGLIPSSGLIVAFGTDILNDAHV
jgi:hypothetical protein